MNRLLELLEFYAADADGAGADSDDEDKDGKSKKKASGEGDGDGDGDDGKGKGKGESNPLLPDLQKWKKRGRTAEDKVEALTKENEKLKAGSTEELQAVIDKHKGELDTRERRLQVTEDALDAGVGKAFLAQALQEADDDSSAAEIIEKAKAHQSAFLDAHGGGSDDEELGDDGKPKRRPFGGGGGGSPDKKGKRIWTPAEVEAVDPLDTKANEELRIAIAEKRIKR